MALAIHKSQTIHKRFEDIFAVFLNQIVDVSKDTTVKGSWSVHLRVIARYRSN